MNHRGKYRAHSKVLRVLAVVLTLSMLLGMSGIQAFAEEDTVVKIQSEASTECDQGGENVIFTPEKQMKGITVKASAANGVLPADVTFSVTALKSEGETAEHYKEVETALTDGETAYDGFQAFDMSFEDVYVRWQYPLQHSVFYIICFHLFFSENHIFSTWVTLCTCS